MRTALALFCFGPASVFALGATTLPRVVVYSPRVANQSPAATFAMPVSALRFEPRVDIHARNLAEGQADVTVRGGTFENIGFQIGASTLLDPQTGHYFAEIPIAPAMLGAPEVAMGAALALGATNATSGAVSHGWREIRSVGAAALGAGQHGLRRAEIYQGYASDLRLLGARLAADVAFAHSRSDGAVPFGDHEFERVNARFQLAGNDVQTDLFAGYQAKFFGWPNLYTPFNSNETENLQTVLLAFNHRAELGRGDFVEFGAYHRRNKDDYAFNRLAPVGPVHPFQHTTWITGVAIGGRATVVPTVAVNYRAERLSDRLRSTSLTFGRYRTRAITKLSVVPERTWVLNSGGSVTLRAGAVYDDTNRDSSALSPTIELARELRRGGLSRLYVSYAEATQVATYTALNSNASAGLFRGNPHLGRTTSRNTELGVSGSIAGWSAEAAVFHRRDDALVDWTFRRGITARTANAVDVDVLGFEAVARRSMPRFDVVLGYTVLDKKEDYRGAAVDASFYALNYARHRLTAAVTARLSGGFELRLDNVARIQAANLLRVVGGDRAVTSSFALAYRPPGINGLELVAQVDNVWDTRFQEVPAVPAAPRQFSATIGYAW